MTKDRVELSNGYRFTGQRVGYSLGCWNVGRTVAQRVVDMFAHTVPHRLPRIGREFRYSLDDSNHLWVSNIAGYYRVTFTSDVEFVSGNPRRVASELHYRLVWTKGNL